MDFVLDGVVMDSISNDPWDVCMVRWGSKSNLMLERVAFIAVVAACDACDIVIRDLSRSSAGLNSAFVVGCAGSGGVVVLNAVKEVESSDGISDIVISASLNLVPNALKCSMLAGVFPQFSVFRLRRVAVWVKGDLGHVKEIWGGEGSSEGTFDHASAAWALRLEEELNFDLVGGEGAGEEGGDSFHI